MQLLYWTVGGRCVGAWDTAHGATQATHNSSAPTHVTENLEAHLLVYPASRWTYRSTGYLTKKYVIQINYDALWLHSAQCTVISRQFCIIMMMTMMMLMMMTIMLQNHIPHLHHCLLLQMFWRGRRILTPQINVLCSRGLLHLVINQAVKAW